MGNARTNKSVFERFDVPKILPESPRNQDLYLDDTVHETEVGSSEIGQRLKCWFTHIAKKS